MRVSAVTGIANVAVACLIVPTLTMPVRSGVKSNDISRAKALLGTAEVYIAAVIVKVSLPRSRKGFDTEVCS